MIRKVLAIILILVVFSINICYAESIELTDENLKTVIEKIISKQSEYKNVGIKVENNKITLTDAEKQYNLNYDITNNPVFYYEFNVKQGIGYEEYKEQEKLLYNFVLLGYVAITNMKGIEVEDSIAYSSLVFLSSSLNNLRNGNNGDLHYVFLEDGAGVSIDNSSSTEDGKEVIKIYKSQFGDHAMEYVNAMFQNNIEFSDDESSSGLNSFKWTIEQINKTNDSCTLRATLTVNLDADFSMLDGFASRLNNPNNGNNETQDDGNITNNNNTNNNTNNNNNVNTEENNELSNNEIKKDNSTTNKELSKTGLSKLIYGIISITVILSIIFMLKIMKNKDIK